MEFNKILVDLVNLEVKIEDEDKALLLLCALPRSYEHFKDTMLYGKENCHLRGIISNAKN
jgi:hypothetical protein